MRHRLRPSVCFLLVGALIADPASLSAAMFARSPFLPIQRSTSARFTETALAENPTSSLNPLVPEGIQDRVSTILYELLSKNRRSSTDDLPSLLRELQDISASHSPGWIHAAHTLLFLNSGAVADYFVHSRKVLQGTDFKNAVIRAGNRLRAHQKELEGSEQRARILNFLKTAEAFQIRSWLIQSLQTPGRALQMGRIDELTSEIPAMADIAEVAPSLSDRLYRSFLARMSGILEYGDPAAPKSMTEELNDLLSRLPKKSVRDLATAQIIMDQWLFNRGFEHNEIILRQLADAVQAPPDSHPNFLLISSLVIWLRAYEFSAGSMDKPGEIQSPELHQTCLFFIPHGKGLLGRLYWPKGGDPLTLAIYPPASFDPKTQPPSMTTIGGWVLHPTGESWQRVHSLRGVFTATYRLDSPKPPASRSLTGMMAMSPNLLHWAGLLQNLPLGMLAVNALALVVSRPFDEQVSTMEPGDKTLTEDLWFGFVAQGLIWMGLLAIPFPGLRGIPSGILLMLPATLLQAMIFATRGGMKGWGNRFLGGLYLGLHWWFPGQALRAAKLHALNNHLLDVGNDVSRLPKPERDFFHTLWSWEQHRLLGHQYWSANESPEGMSPEDREQEEDFSAHRPMRQGREWIRRIAETEKPLSITPAFGIVALWLTRRIKWPDWTAILLSGFLEAYTLGGLIGLGILHGFTNGMHVHSALSSGLTCSIGLLLVLYLSYVVEDPEHLYWKHRALLQPGESPQLQTHERATLIETLLISASHLLYRAVFLGTLLFLYRHGLSLLHATLGAAWMEGSIHSLRDLLVRHGPLSGVPKQIISFAQRRLKKSA